jgi:NitT/TauT family transport system permease protein
VTTGPNRTATIGTLPGGGAAPQRRDGLQLQHWLKVVAPPTIAILLVLAIWQLGVQMTGVAIFILPGPGDVVVALWKDAPILLPNAWITLQEILLGLAISIFVGIPLAVMLVSFKPIERALYPLLIGSQVVPKVALAPLFLIWFGFGLLPKIVMVVLMAFFPIVINTAIGLRGIEIEKLYLARSMGASALTTLVRFQMPGALPSMFGGIKLATTLAVIGAVVGEFVGASEGLGYQIQQGMARLNAPLTFAAIVYLTFIGMLLFFIVDMIERLALPWHVSRRADFNIT